MALFEGNPPTLIKAESKVWRCANCKTWLVRIPAFMGPDFFGKGHQCEKCGCTSVMGTPGRPFGPKSKVWERVVMEFNEAWTYIDYPVFVVCDPPLEQVPEWVAYYHDEEDENDDCEECDMHECPTCAGFGFVSKADYYKDWINYMNVEIECPDCKGLGYVDIVKYQ